MPSINNPLVEWTRDITGERFLAWGVGTYVQLIMMVASIALIFYFLFGGLMWLTAGGDAKKVESAGKQLTNAIVGMVIIAAGWAFIMVFGTVLHLNPAQNGISLPNLGP